jgi:acyl-coenzyme A thioesterase PaaI-like protein
MSEEAAADAVGPSLQERYAPHNRCFGCGPANPQGLRLRSFPAADDAEQLVCTWTPQPHHEAFENVLNGGIIGALLDCHSNWTAVWHLMRRDGLDKAPCAVTADFHVRMRHPTPSAAPVTLRSRVVESQAGRVQVHAELASAGKVTATCDGTFVAVGPGHPAYHRW